MFYLTPLAAALQGIGFGSMQTSLQGLLEITIVPEPLEILGSMAAGLKVKRRVRRWRTLASVPDWPDLFHIEQEDEELLMEIGAL